MPNLLDVRGIFPPIDIVVAILGTEDFDVTEIDRSSIELEGVSPRHWSIVWDVATPFEGEMVDCEDCTRDGRDGYADLALSFRKWQIIEALGEVENGECRILTLTAHLKDDFGGTEIQGMDGVKIIKRRIFFPWGK